jgi:Spy/CpxP family protein refolding chaperone
MAAVLLCSAGMVMAAGARAQDAPQGPPPGGGQGRGMMMDPGARAGMMQKQLGLSDDQTTQVKAVFADEQSKMQALRSSGGDPADMRPKMMAIREDSTAKLKGILTADQFTKYQEMMQQMRQRGGGGAPPPPASL